MNFRSSAVLGLFASGLLLGLGCSKPEEASAPPPTEAPKKAEVPVVEPKSATEAAPAVVQQVSTQQVQTQAVVVPPAPQGAVTDAQAQAASLTSKTQSIIDNVKQLLANNKWSEALKMLTDLAGTKLTPEQQATVDGLKQQALKLGQDAAAAKAADQSSKALGNLLQKK